MFRAFSLVGSALAVALTVLPAQAVTIHTEFVGNLTDGSVYTGSAGGGIAGTPLLPNDPTGFVFTYQFGYNPPPDLLALNTTTNNNIGSTYGIINFVVTWQLQGGPVLATFPGSTANVLLPLTVGGIYELIMTGVANGSQGGFFNYSLVSEGGPAETPIPGAVFLFGTVLAGVGGMQMMRRRRTARPTEA